jgi:mono/diheme cytochrome c family protein
VRLAALALAAFASVAMAGGAGTPATTGPGEPADASAAGKLAQGKAVFAQWCAGCHGPFPGMGRFPPAGSFRLHQRYGDTRPAALEDRIDLTADYIRTAVRVGLPIMPPLRKTEVSDAELDAVIAYLTRDRRK